jgi:CBS domain-containing protein
LKALRAIWFSRNSGLQQAAKICNRVIIKLSCYRGEKEGRMSVEAVLRESKIRQLDPSQPVCVEMTATLAEVIESMRARRCGYVLVCEGDRAVGIFTERDVLNKVAGQPLSPASPISSLMTANPKTITAEDSLAEAIRLMDEGDYRHLPVVDRAGRVQGVISIQDVIEFLAELYPTEVLNLPPLLHQQIRSREGG